MPIKIPNNLPAAEILNRENIFFMTETRAMTQDIRALRVLIMNLMPTKIETETQFARVLGNSPIQIELELIAPSNREFKNTSHEHMLSFYKTFDDVKDQTFDGLIITGAPVEHLEFEEVDYWDELVELMDWSKVHVHSTLYVCWETRPSRSNWNSSHPATVSSRTPPTSICCPSIRPSTM